MHLVRNLKIRNHLRKAKSCGSQHPPLTPRYMASRLPACSSIQRLGLQQRHLIYHPSRYQLRGFHLLTILYPPLVFTGLVLALWAYKCLVMIIFQNKIIYMPSMPPYSRSEKIADYEVLCRPVVWREERIRSADGVEVALAVGSIPRSHDIPRDMIAESSTGGIGREVVILYFQGNGSSLPPRLPGLSQVLKSLDTNSRTANPAFYTIVALSYRGFWTSHGRPSEHGVNLDAAAILAWAAAEYPKSRIVLWGQSLGAGVAVRAAAAKLELEGNDSDLYLKDQVKTPKIKGLLLETPFTSVRAILLALYPQKWLPYRYLSPFLWNHWDSIQGLSRIAKYNAKPKVLILPAGDDELVPQAQGLELERFCKQGDIDVERIVVNGALHHEVLRKMRGRAAVMDFLRRIAEQD